MIRYACPPGSAKGILVEGASLSVAAGGSGCYDEGCFDGYDDAIDYMR
jgi:hypothetical protein